ncbi:hypothetical protein N752_14785 [Desulforamulus aquiferis]|nr:signal peptidase II [Desulforamulus aquiferis]RYD04635.1 hypothetical protein N752_14785 [Desulforamulus aquiferis]
MIRLAIVMGVTLFLDYYTKLIVINKMALGESIPVWPGVFHLTYIQNPGAAFGMLAGKTWFLLQ